MKKLTAFIVLTFSLSQFAIPQTAEPQTRREPPADFKSDGCSLWPDGDYRSCCEAHDLDYYYGGTKAERKASDKRLRDCVRGKGHKYISRMMYLGVRIAGGAWLRAPFSWGFGTRRLKPKEPQK